MGSAQDVQTPADTEGIRDLLRKEVSPFDGFPNVPIDILFFDINHDGIPDALVSHRFDTDAGGCHGNDWSLYRFENGEWNQSPFKETNDDNWSNYNSVFARGNDFYTLTEDGQKPKLFLIYFSRCRQLDGEMEFSQDGHEITIDNEGYLKTIPIPALSTNYVPREDEAGYWLETTEMQKKLTPLSIETVHVQRKNEDEKAQPVATAEEENSGTRNEKSEIKKPTVTGTGNEPEQQKETNRLWLYLALALGGLCAVFYFLRKK